MALFESRVNSGHPCSRRHSFQSGMQMPRCSDQPCGSYVGWVVQSRFTRSLVQTTVGPACQESRCQRKRVGARELGAVVSPPGGRSVVKKIGHGQWRSKRQTEDDFSAAPRTWHQAAGLWRVSFPCVAHLLAYVPASSPIVLPKNGR